MATPRFYGSPTNGYDNGGVLPAGYQQAFNDSGRPVRILTAAQLDAMLQDLSDQYGIDNKDTEDGTP